MNSTIQVHNERAASMWGAGGIDYDEVSRSIADAIEHCVLRLGPRPGERILDLCTGTGWTSRVVARRGAVVTGVDFAVELINAARAMARTERLPIDYQLGDAEDLPFRDGEFDAVVSTFGVMFASNPERAAGELARVVRRGGRIALATWLSDSTIARMFEMMRRHRPAQPAPAPPSPFEWGRVERIRALLGESFDLRFEQGVTWYREASGEAAWQTFFTGYGPTRSLALSLEPVQREALREDFVAFHASFPTELGISMPRGYLVTVGVRL
jgi:SAM-dependent methyltransferase